MASDSTTQFKANFPFVTANSKHSPQPQSLWHFVEHIMGRGFMLFFTLSAFFFMLHARADGSPTNSGTNSLNLRNRNLLENPEPEKSIADPPSEKEAPLSAEKTDDEERETPAEGPAEWESRKIRKHHSSDKSVAGGGVIIGGLVTAIFAAVYCYIRVTRRRHTEILQ